MIPPHAKEFLEAFGGSAALSLALKPKKGRLDIYNDVDDDLFNVFCCIKERPNALARELKFLPRPRPHLIPVLPPDRGTPADYFRHIEDEKEILRDPACFTREQAEELLKVLEGRTELFDVVRAAAFLMRQYGSFSGTGNSVAIKELNVEAIVQRLPEVNQRIQTIFLENRDALELIASRGSPDGVVYADPPYVGRGEDVPRGVPAGKPRAAAGYPAGLPGIRHCLL